MTLNLPTQVSRTRIGPVEVSTIICLTGRGREMAETMIFIDDGVTVEGLTDQRGERDDKSAANALHQKWVTKVRAAVAA